MIPAHMSVLGWSIPESLVLWCACEQWPITDKKQIITSYSET